MFGTVDLQGQGGQVDREIQDDPAEGSALRG